MEKLIVKTMRDLLIKATELNALVIVAEDMHWSDTSTIELRESLFPLVETQRIVFINVFRSGYNEISKWIVETVKNYRNFTECWPTIIIGGFNRVNLQLMDLTLRFHFKSTAQEDLPSILRVNGFLSFTCRRYRVSFSAGRDCSQSQSIKSSPFSRVFK